MTDLDTLMATKLQQAQTDYRVSAELTLLLAELVEHVPKDKRQLFKTAVLNPQVRRKDKVAQAVLFWSDRTQVDAWVKRTKFSDSFDELET